MNAADVTLAAAGSESPGARAHSEFTPAQRTTAEQSTAVDAALVVAGGESPSARARAHSDYIVQWTNMSGDCREGPGGVVDHGWLNVINLSLGFIPPDADPDDLTLGIALRSQLPPGSTPLPLESVSVVITADKGHVELDATRVHAVRAAPGVGAAAGCYAQQGAAGTAQQRAGSAQQRAQQAVGSAQQAAGSAQQAAGIAQQAAVSAQHGARAGITGSGTGVTGAGAVGLADENGRADTSIAGAGAGAASKGTGLAGAGASSAQQVAGAGSAQAGGFLRGVGAAAGAASDLHTGPLALEVVDTKWDLERSGTALLQRHSATFGSSGSDAPGNAKGAGEANFGGDEANLGGDEDGDGESSGTDFFAAALRTSAGEQNAAVGEAASATSHGMTSSSRHLFPLILNSEISPVRVTRCTPPLGERRVTSDRAHPLHAVVYLKDHSVGGNDVTDLVNKLIFCE